MRIITGSTGLNHITANDDGAMHAAIFGEGCYVLGAGEQFPCTVVGNTQVQIGQGEGLMYGRHFRTPRGSVDTLAIQAGASGYNRNDIIAAHYQSTGSYESIDLVVLTGASTTGAAADPSFAQDDISAGATESYMPLYRVRLSGADIESVERLFELRPVVSEGAPVDNTVTETGANAVSGAAVAEYVAEQMEAEKSTSETVTVTAASWTGKEAPFTAVVASEIATADNHLIVGAGGAITVEQQSAMVAAMIICTDQSAGSITLSAFGSVPEIDLPVNIICVG